MTWSPPPPPPFPFYPQATSGLLRSTMGHALRTLQQNRELLLATASVFVNEPLLDWELHAKKDMANGRFRSMGDAEAEAATQETVGTYARDKLSSLEAKLRRQNPAMVTRMLIEASKPAKQQGTTEKVKEVIKGDHSRRNESETRRVRYSEQQCSTVLEQVDVLIDMATDENILGRTWIGWEPWV